MEVAAAEKREERAPTEQRIDELLDRFDALLEHAESRAAREERAVRALELLAQNEQRKLSEREDAARRAERKTGPTTAAAEAEVRARIARLERRAR
jgi:hypothetical protein